MRAFLFSIATVLAGAVLTSSPADAGMRITCYCADGKQKSWIHYNRACEVHFKKPHTTLAKPKNPADVCTEHEWAQFRTYLCVKSLCTYPHVKASL